MKQPQAQTATSSPAPGQVVLTGPPGAGKSTVARLLADRLSPSVHLHSDDVWHFIKQGWVAPGDPSADVLHPLIDAAAEAGAECFVIDAGWYANGGDWWVGVGEWQPSNGRFPNGINEVLDHIRRRGMVPGLWLEPEVVGINSPVALKLPDSAFLQRDGVRVSDHGRYHLDFTADATVAFLDEVLDHLVNDHGVGYFKFDYNIRADVGSDANTANTASTGHGLLLHNRAYLAWVDALRQRHPRLVLETARPAVCARISRPSPGSICSQRPTRKTSTPTRQSPRRRRCWYCPNRPETG
jgi:hypothetical protein